MAKVNGCAISSPSKLGRNDLLRSALAHVSFKETVCVKSAVSDEAFAKVDTAASAGFHEQCVQLVKEGNLYGVATEFTPTWTTHQQRSSKEAKANAAYLCAPKDRILVPPHVALPWECQPEVFVSASLQHPPYVAELKSVGEEVYNQVMTYGVFGLLHSYFKLPEGEPSMPVGTAASRRRFYLKPLVGYGLVAFAHCGYLVALEWVGKLFMAPARSRTINPVP